MTEQFPVASIYHRDGGGIPRHLAVAGVFTLTVALVVGGGAFGASAEEAAQGAATGTSETTDSGTSGSGSAGAESSGAESSDSESSGSGSSDDSKLTDAAAELADNERVRAIARAAVTAVQGEPAESGSADSPTEPTDEPTEPADPPVDEPVPPTDPTEPTEPPTDPADPTEPSTDPAEPTDPPVDETDPPTDPEDPTDPPVDETDPPTDPAEPTDPPGEDTGAPVTPTDPTVPPTAGPPVTETNPIPVRPRPTARPNAAAEAAAQAARAAAAERAAAVAAAQAALDTARRAYDDARRAFAAATADHDAAQLRADQIHELATDAETRAIRSERALTALVRALTRQGSGNPTAGVLLDSRGGGNILYQLGTLDQLSSLTGNLEVVRARAEADRARADRLAADDAAAQQLLESIPLEATRAASDSARAAFDAASDALASLRTSAPVGLVGLTPLAELLAADTGQLSDQGWAHPAIGRVSDGFGPRPIRPVPGVGPFHHGTDIGAECNAGIYAATSGVVVAAGSEGTYGNWILIDHGDGIETGYAHVAADATLVTVGEPVIAGQVIAGVGSTGASTGCHLHFEVRIDGTRVDAEAFMAERGVVLGAQ